jgi:hypothetical protein
MRKEGPDIDMPFGNPTILHPRVMNDRDQPVAVPADIEDYIPLHIIGILENLPHLVEIPPPRILRDFAPGHDLFGRTGILFQGSVQVLFGNNMHKGPANDLAQLEPPPRPKILCKTKSVNKNFAL